MNFANLWFNITEWFRDRTERNNLLRSFNTAAREAFVAGNVPTLLRASLSRGNSAYRHSFSDRFHSGFRVVAFSGCQLSKTDIKSIGDTILADDVLVRRMVVLGWDTLEVCCDDGAYGCRWQLKEYTLLTNKN